MSERLAPGHAVDIAPGIRRVVAPNPGMMTGPGTNSYLVGDGDIAVIDPGPAIDAHIDTLYDLAGDRVRWILVTHTHSDHSPAVRALAARTAAAVWGLPAPPGQHQDASFAPTHRPADGERLQIGDTSLEVLHTPGHASNHLCFLHRPTRMLFTGDHIINGSTVVIDPPDGSMGDYLNALERLAGLDVAAIAGGHGEVIDDPAAAIAELIRHRLAREDRVRSALTERPGSLPAELVAAAYPGLDERLHRLAERSLLAHLIKLGEDGEAVAADDGRWTPAVSS